MDYAASLGNARRGGPLVENIPLDYLRQCTDGFAEAQLLDEGAFGRVYHGADAAQDGGLVAFAVKRLNDAVHFGGNAVRRAAAAQGLQREIDVLSRFKHPNIILLLGHAREGAEHCLVYELGAEGSLAACLVDDAKATRLTWKIRVRVATGVVRALNYLHRHLPGTPVFHRDIKSANIVLCEGFVPKLIDCGLSMLLDEEQAAAGQPRLGPQCRPGQKRRKWTTPGNAFVKLAPMAS